jgi:hypothetical protein
MLLFKYPPSLTNTYLSLPDYSVMMEQALSRDPQKLKDFWRAFNTHVDARRPKEKGQILLGDEYLVEQGKKIYFDYETAVSDAKPYLLPSYASQQNVPKNHDYHPLVPVILDIAPSQRTALLPDILATIAKNQERDRLAALGSSALKNPIVNQDEVPTVITNKNSPKVETVPNNKRQRVRSLPYTIAASVLAAAGGGYGGFYFSQPSNPVTAVAPLANGDDPKKITDDIADPNSRVTVIPVTEKAKKKQKPEKLTDDEIERWQKFISDLLKNKP